MADHILTEETFPIVGWAGPGGDMIRDDVMAGMAEAGFTVICATSASSTTAFSGRAPVLCRRATHP